MNYIKVNDSGTRKLINVEYITCITRINSSACYICYLSYDDVEGKPFRIERAQTNMSFEDLEDEINKRED